MEKVMYSELPKRITYMRHHDGSSEAKLRKNIEEIITEDGTMWTANEVYIPHTMLTQEEIEAQFDSYFKIEEPETTIEDLTEALDILTNIVLGE